MSRRRLFQALFAAVVTLCILAFSGVLSAQGQSQAAFERVKEVQERHTAELMARPGVVGTAVGLSESNQPAVLVLLEEAGAVGIPAQLEGVPVQRIFTGKIEALGARKAPPGKGKGKPRTSIDPTARFDRPVPIGVSTGNANEISAGTIACRVVDGDGNVYALSNNHVYARENQAQVHEEEEVLQPGRYDGGIPGLDHLGWLSAYVSLDFTDLPNTVDAAIAVSSLDDLGNSTPANGYGTPSSGITAAEIGMAVQKYGRTTSLTKGTVTGINAVVNVGYSSGPALFVNQIIVESRKPFIKAGDSGSLLVTDPGNSPVGLLFAGDASGKLAVANDIDAVLGAFGVSIDGE
jgi:hypothetical protein